MFTYVVTGASRGIGLEYVRQILQKNGTKVFACCRNPSSAANLTELKHLSGDRLSIQKLDVTDEISVKASAGEISKLASDGVDVLINNAGVMIRAGGLIKTKKTELESMLATNVSGPVITTQEFIPLLERGKRKLIINIGSILGSIKINGNAPSTMGYGVTKAALNMVTACLAKELGEKNFTVISLHPGWVQTDMGGKQAFVTVENSISKMLQVVDSLSNSDNGKFFDSDGNTLPW
ncbi:hypothetical protein K7432_011408 [Basidiobolus ranarum]|uniref:Uncharacterized protein n=1 Tax=Basidiobolus ranarum TaxID=34480 RepID=A0ABR2WME1_9FUNG